MMLRTDGYLRGDKVRYSDGVGCCVWRAFEQFGEGEDCGPCVDFSYDDIDNIIFLVQKMIGKKNENIDAELDLLINKYLQGIGLPFSEDDLPDFLDLLKQMKNVDAEVYDYEEDSE